MTVEQFLNRKADTGLNYAVIGVRKGSAVFISYSSPTVRWFVKLVLYVFYGSFIDLLIAFVFSTPALQYSLLVSASR